MLWAGQGEKGRKRGGEGPIELIPLKRIELLPLFLLANDIPTRISSPARTDTIALIIWTLLLCFVH